MNTIQYYNITIRIRSYFNNLLLKLLLCTFHLHLFRFSPKYIIELLYFMIHLSEYRNPSITL